jgi:hypothetical protein
MSKHKAVAEMDEIQEKLVSGQLDVADLSESQKQDLGIVEEHPSVPADLKEEGFEVIKEEAPKMVRKSPTPKKVKCAFCGKEAFSQSFRVTVGAVDPGSRTYVCRRKGGCEVTLPPQDSSVTQHTHTEAKSE